MKHTHEHCPLCWQLVTHRQARIDDLRKAVALLEAEITEIREGGRHNAYHESQRTP